MKSEFFLKKIMYTSTKNVLRSDSNVSEKEKREGEASLDSLCTCVNLVRFVVSMDGGHAGHGDR